MSEDFGFLMHGQGTIGPFSTEQVPVKQRGYPHTGQWLARFEGKWRVIFVRVKGSLFIRYRGEKINIQIEGV